MIDQPSAEASLIKILRNFALLATVMLASGIYNLIMSIVAFRNGDWKAWIYVTFVPLAIAGGVLALSARSKMRNVPAAENGEEAAPDDAGRR